MTSSQSKYLCPVCGYNELTAPPFQNMPPISPKIYKVSPPYSKHWGMGSFEVCPCCGFEFGADDEGMEPDSDTSFQEYLRYWIIEQDAQWFDAEMRPDNWSLDEQLSAAGIPKPDLLLK